GVWYGNDDYLPLNRMTGGSLPAMTWHQVMAYAHQGIELKNLIGVAPNPSTVAPADIVAEGTNNGNENLPRPALLTSRGSQTLQRIEQLMENIHTLPAPAPAPVPSGRRAETAPQPATPASSSGAVATAGRPGVRGN